MSYVLVLHVFEVFKKQDGVERIVALPLQSVDNLPLNQHALSPSATNRRALRKSSNATTKFILGSDHHPFGTPR